MYKKFVFNSRIPKVIEMKNIKFYQTWQFNMWSTIVMVVSLYAAYFFYYPVMELIKQSRFDTQSQAVLINYEARKMLYQGYEGGTYTKVKNYIVYYHYQIAGQTYQGQDILPGKAAIGLTLKHILNSPDRIIKIKYQSDTPAKSVVDL